MFLKKKEEKEPVAANAVIEPAKTETAKMATSSATTETFEDMISRRFGKPRSALGPGTVIQGKLSFDTPVVIEGKLGGEVYSTETLIVGKTGTVSAQLRVKNLIVAGTVVGNAIVVADCIELLRGGKIEGDISSKRLLIEEGSAFNGNCKMNIEPAQQAVAKAEQAKPTTSVKETALSPEELKRAAEMVRNAEHATGNKPQQQKLITDKPTEKTAPVVS